jgi:hypothetical protein
MGAGNERPVVSSLRLKGRPAPLGGGEPHHRLTAARASSGFASLTHDSRRPRTAFCAHSTLDPLGDESPMDHHGLIEATLPEAPP